MTINEILNISDINLVEGESKSGKLTFSIYALTKNPDIKKIAIISTIQKNLLQKRLSSIKKLNNPSMNRLIDNAKLFCLKQNWNEIKAIYGFDFIFDDVEKIISENRSDAIILHRIDLMFEEAEYEFGRVFLEKVIEIANKNHIKLYITLLADSFLCRHIENYTDLNVIITKNGNERIIKIKHSLYPISENEFILKYTNRQLTLSNENKTPQYFQKKPYILLISKNRYLIEFCKYLLNKEFDFDTALDTAEIISKVVDKPEIIIYDSEDKEINTQICKIVKDKNIITHIIYLLNKEYIRNDDKIQLTTAGCYEILPKHFNIIEFIILIEKITNKHFYSPKIMLLPKHKISSNYENFCKNILHLKKEGIYFSIVKIPYKDENILKKLRENDIVYYDDKKMVICFLNTTKYIFENFINKKLNLKIYEIQEVINWDKKC